MLLILKPHYHVHLTLRYRHPILQTKEVVKLQPRTTIMKKHLHHHVSFLVNQSLITQGFGNDGNRLFHFSSGFVQPHTIVQKRYLIQKELKPAIDEYLSQKIEEDHRYYQYHPSEAKRLAVSYLQEKTVRQALAHLIPHRRPLVLLHHANVLQRELAYIVQPAGRRQEIALTYANRMLPEHSATQQSVDPTAQVTKKEIIVEKVEIEHLIKAVYQEIEKRMQQKQQRKGR